MKPRTIDIKFHELCDEIDYWKGQAEYYKDLYEKEVMQRNVESKERLLQTQKDVANTLMFALHATDDKDGNLVIDKKSREELAKNWKK